MTMDTHRGGLRVEAAVLGAVTNKTASPATSDSSERSGSPGHSPPPLNNNNRGEKVLKRSFDVAFLMAPDDLSTIRKRHQQQEQQLRLVTTASLMMRSAMTPLNVSVTPPQPAEPVQHHQALSRHILQHHPPSLLMYRHAEDADPDTEPDTEPAVVRSAFTKVSAAGPSGPGLLLMHSASPSSVSSLSGGLSPDQTAYQNSLSPSPTPPTGSAPASSPQYTMAYQPPPSGLPYGAPPFFVPQTHAPPHQQTTPPSPLDKERKARRYSPPSGATAFPFAGYPKAAVPGPGGPDLFPKLRAGAPSVLYPDSLAAYTNLAAAAAAAYPFGAPGPGSTPGPGPGHGSALAAAAVVSASLLPPTFAALSLPAQNVCAKCNVSFRMTSDLVYHMRAHHKGDHTSTDPGRRRREQDKLKCPVCAESFRERHHLTRHMTAHQDKEGDAAEDLEAVQSEPPIPRRRSSTK